MADANMPATTIEITIAMMMMATTMTTIPQQYQHHQHYHKEPCGDIGYFVPSRCTTYLSATSYQHYCTDDND